MTSKNNNNNNFNINKKSQTFNSNIPSDTSCLTEGGTACLWLPSPRPRSLVLLLAVAVLF